MDPLSSQIKSNETVPAPSNTVKVILDVSGIYPLINHRNLILKVPTSPLDKCNITCGCRLEQRYDRLYCAPFSLGKKSVFDWPLYICPQNFRNLADEVFWWRDQDHLESLSHSEVPCYERQLQDGAIFYVSGWNLNDFFSIVYPYLKHKFILVTGESDLTVPYGHHKHLVMEDSLIIHWFGQNGDNGGEPMRFSHIPIGINCRYQADYLDRMRAIAQNDNIAKINSHMKLTQFDYYPMDITDKAQKLLLLNFDPTTDPTGLRKSIWNKACDANLAGNWLEFADCIGKDQGVLVYMDQMESLHRRNLRYPFWLSPRGNGIDCHRTWEALYLGRIPIIAHTSIDPLFEGLPVVFVDDWNQITRAFLEERYKTIMEKYHANEYKLERLFPEYWHQQILKMSAYYHSASNKTFSLEQRPPRCWTP